MFVIVGWLLALGCIFGVYVAHGGNIGVILRALPFELITILGAALGAFLANNQMKVVKASLRGLGQCFKGGRFSKTRYMELLALMFDILQKARKEGLMAIEKDVESPQESPLFQKYPTLARDHHVIEFITDYLRMMVSGNLNAHEIESLMDSEIETHHQEEHAAVVRECREELEAIVEPAACVHRSVTAWGTALAWWTVSLAEGDLVPHPVEVDEILWLSLEEMLADPTLLTGNREFLEAVVTGRVRL